MTNKAESILS